MVFETTKSVLFYLDTRVRSSGSIGAPRFTFPNNLIGIKPQQGEKVRLTMQEASIEYTFYQTEEFNNKVYVKESAGGVVNNRIVSIPIGNYNLVTFIVELTRALNEGSLYVYTIEYIPETNQLRYVATAAGGGPPGTVVFIFDSDVAFEETGTPLNESLNEMMGFLVGVTIQLQLNTVNNTLFCTSTVPVTMSPGVENLYVTIQNSCSNFGNANVSNTFSASNILAKIPVSNPPFSTLFFYDLNSKEASPFWKPPEVDNPEQLHRTFQISIFSHHICDYLVGLVTRTNFSYPFARTFWLGGSFFGISS